MPTFDSTKRARIIDECFRPYAKGLANTVSALLHRFNRCLIIDAHSFPSVALPYEEKNLERPDLCLGYNPYHAPEVLIEAIEKEAQLYGWTTSRNEPFAGSYVPLEFYQTDPRVTSVMLEVNRSLYMNEANGEKSKGFATMAKGVAALVSVAVLYEAFRHTSFIANVEEEAIELRVDKHSEPLDRVLAKFDANTWAFITAYNPGGKSSTARANQLADEALIEKLSSRGYGRF